MIEIINRQNNHWIDSRSFQFLLNTLAEQYDLNDPEISLAFVNDDEIKTLNQKYLNKNNPTDVLSFPIGEKGPDGKFYLGDIIISVPRAYEQSVEKKHSLENELKLLTIHGFLHLIGYEHFKGIEEEEKKIWGFLKGE